MLQELWRFYFLAGAKKGYSQPCANFKIVFLFLSYVYVLGSNGFLTYIYWSVLSWGLEGHFQKSFPCFSVSLLTSSSLSLQQSPFFSVNFSRSVFLLFPDLSLQLKEDHWAFLNPPFLFLQPVTGGDCRVLLFFFVSVSDKYYFVYFVFSLFKLESKFSLCYYT